MDNLYGVGRSLDGCMTDWNGIGDGVHKLLLVRKDFPFRNVRVVLCLCCCWCLVLMTLLFFLLLPFWLLALLYVTYGRIGGWMEYLCSFLALVTDAHIASWASMVLYGVVASCLVLFSLAVWVGPWDRLTGFFGFDLGYLCCRSCCSVSFNSSS